MLEVVEQTGVPSENHRLTPSHWQLSTVFSNPGSGDAIDHMAIRAGHGSGERQQAVNGNTLDHSTTRAALH